MRIFKKSIHSLSYLVVRAVVFGIEELAALKVYVPQPLTSGLGTHFRKLTKVKERVSGDLPSSYLDAYGGITRDQKEGTKPSIRGQQKYVCNVQV